MAATGKGQGRLVADRRYQTRAAAPAKPAKPPRTPRSRKPARSGIAGFILGSFGLIWRIFWGVTWRVGAVTAFGLAGWIFVIYSSLPPLDDLLDGRARGSVTFLDVNERTFAYRGETFGAATAGSVSPFLHDAVVATEDKRFYRHLGISPRGIASAIRINLAAGRGPLSGNGGSTITQQVAKLVCLGVEYDASKWENEAAYEADCRQGGIWRKIKEIPYAMAMEFKYSKEEILTIYFNRAYLGGGARGFEAASERYFGKSAAEVTAAEAAMLAGLLKAPSLYAPTNNLQRAQDRAAVVIRLMEEQGYLTPDEADAAREEPARLSSQAVSQSGGYFADWVMETTPEFLAGETTEDIVMRTTLDPRLQAAAEEALAWVFENKVSDGSNAQAAIVVMSADGAVRAMVGGRQTEAAGSFNRATQALRQTGSSFKPFVYAAALDLGWHPLDYVDDSPLCIYTAGSGEWCPDNYDREFKGQITLVQALEESRNIPAVRLSESVGRDVVRAVAAQFGIQSDLAAGPALALGASESSLLEMTGAYAGILNGGSAVAPYGIVELRIKGDDEALFGATGGIKERVISEQAARALTYMMAQVINSGTGGRARLDAREAAGKTGTTNSARDAWFVGFTADYVVGVWMGYDDNRPLTGVTGAGLPAEIWHEVMVRVNEGVPARPLPMELPAVTASQQPYQPEPVIVQPGMSEQDINEQILRDVLRSLGN
jgi:penicillin-binding protein 1A